MGDEVRIAHLFEFAFGWNGGGDGIGMEEVHELGVEYQNDTRRICAKLNARGVTLPALSSNSHLAKALDAIVKAVLDVNALDVDENVGGQTVDVMVVDACENADDLEDTVDLEQWPVTTGLHLCPSTLSSIRLLFPALVIMIARAEQVEVTRAGIVVLGKVNVVAVVVMVVIDPTCSQRIQTLLLILAEACRATDLDLLASLLDAVVVKAKA
ncbi:hypothetical protein BDQ12DRAFT_668161 [Crucibulum laeve]|uniref:Uncharacterized protein n=1 Tax=Crucibulum laeve TaxID=68775 RepID=A0A5C3LTB4_9AGAR|nr:hypothetical protein BDQ12DRAFT_668161 [Crucibulum laeve]